MTPLTLRTRSIPVAALFAATLGLSACATEQPVAAVDQLQQPTMAPEQSISEACIISNTAVDDLVVRAESQITDGLANAKADALQNTWPSFDFLHLDAGEALTTVRETVINPKVSAAIDRVFVQLDGFSAIEQPETPLGVPAYLTSLATQVSQLSKAGTDLAQLCGTVLPPRGTN